jgi:hypothetical protein
MLVREPPEAVVTLVGAVLPSLGKFCRTVRQFGSMP